MGAEQADISLKNQIAEELSLLGDGLAGGLDLSDTDHSLRTAPIFTGDALHAVGAHIFPQRASYGRILSQHAEGFPGAVQSPSLYINTNAPFSALVCGVQGSGKSHSTSVLLESCLITDPRLGTLPAPLCGLVFHFDTAAGGGAVQPCEAAYLASLDKNRGGSAMAPKVKVLVLPSNLHSMQNVYAGLPGVVVEPLHFAPNDISGERLLSMMKIDSEKNMPLYMECILTILRSMEGTFNYQQFRQRLAEQDFDRQQKMMLNQRLAILDSCLKGGTESNRAASHFRPGQLTIIDLSDPFMDAASACGFFDLILGLFVEADAGSNGKVIVLDEAHKYLSSNGSSGRLSDSLLTVIRQQRHFNMRVLISTQEPTVVPEKFIDLCSFVIAHRFSSPGWLKHLVQHISASESSLDDWFKKVVALRTGQGMLFAPAGLGVLDSESGHLSERERVAPFGQGYLLVRSRIRITRDGGHSLLAVSDPNNNPRLGRVSTSPPTDINSSRSRSTTENTLFDGYTGSNNGVPPPAFTTSVPIISNPVPAPTARSKPPIPPRYRSLISFLRKCRDAGNHNVKWASLGEYRKSHPDLYPKGGIRPFLEGAQAEGLVEIGGYGGSEWVELADTN